MKQVSSVVKRIDQLSPDELPSADAPVPVAVKMVWPENGPQSARHAKTLEALRRMPGVSLALLVSGEPEGFRRAYPGVIVKRLQDHPELDESSNAGVG
ncbi:hypothetical protein NL393_29855 [Klebsiella pneumoniae]|nr:hypothetical protein [Klebsiella pneumoniae]